ncbi:MAG: response regulator [Lachnospiraceae bacterium]|nr:response regulator [Lachnospiraceae bacterium]
MRFVAVDDLEPGMKLGRKIINRNVVSMLQKGVVLNEMTIARLKINGYLGAYIVDDISEDIEIGETISEQTFEEGVTAVEEADVGSIIEVAKQMVADISKLDRISVDMLDLRSFDDYTYHHSVNVAVYAVAVAAKMELPEEKIQEVAVAALCHDLGKTKIDPAIINKKGRLDDDEFEEIRRHPKYSYDMLYDNELVSSSVRQAVICHHENENGSGYPNGKESFEIPLSAKIIHAVDVYDALTSRRAYKEPYAPVDALEYITGGKGILFDPRVVEVMMTVIPAYPPGMDVILSNGERAVVSAHTTLALRPVIKLHGTGKEIDLSKDPDYSTVFITASGLLLQESSEVESLNEGRPGKDVIKKKVLVVDDSSISRGQTKSALQSVYDVTSLESGTACINYIKAKGAPDLLIMDIDMPGMDGVTTVENLHEYDTGDMKIVFLTAVADRDTVIRCKMAGAADYILKPVNPIYLRERVSIAIDKNLDR